MHLILCVALLSTESYYANTTTVGWCIILFVDNDEQKESAHLHLRI